MTNLATLLTDNINGATFITIDTETDVKLKGGKKNPLQGKVTKRVVGSNVMVFQNKKKSGYESMVMRRLEKEGKDPSSFTLKPRAWGHRLQGAPFVEHNGNYYVEVIFLHPGKTEYLVDGNVTDPNAITGMPERKEEAVQGGLNNKVVIRTYRVDNIRKITINKQTYSDLTFNLPH
jgi:hypothetical protein